MELFRKIKHDLSIKTISLEDHEINQVNFTLRKHLIIINYYENQSFVNPPKKAAAPDRTELTEVGGFFTDSDGFILLLCKRKNH